MKRKEATKMTKNILFLDIDGPMIPVVFLKYHPDNRKPYPGKLPLTSIVDYWKMSDIAVHSLNLMQDLHSFDTVISSTWRKYCSKEQIEDLFMVNGLNLPLHEDWKTNNLGGSFSGQYDCTRADEIHEWIVRNRPSDYLILDDPSSGSSLESTTKLNQERIVLVNHDTGLGSYDLQKMFGVIKIWNKL
jgi:hypothetical protein